MGTRIRNHREARIKTSVPSVADGIQQVLSTMQIVTISEAQRDFRLQQGIPDKPVKHALTIA